MTDIPPRQLTASAGTPPAPSEIDSQEHLYKTLEELYSCTQRPRALKKHTSCKFAGR